MAKITSLPNHIAIILDGNGRWAKDVAFHVLWVIITVL